MAVVGAWPKRCEICGVPIKRQSYTWKIGDEKKRACPNCNRTLERRQSQRATRRFK
jgi:ribosome-binding protein aMBF1 (putative translation factor)